MRRIVFFGNCYAATLESVFSRSLAPRAGVVASYVSCYDETGRADAMRTLAEADVVVEQLFDSDQTITLDRDATSARIIPFPTVSLGSLWPYGGVAHGRNTALPHWQCGPYDYLMGDNYLNRRVNEGVSPEVAVRDYLNLDIAKAAHLDRLHELVIDRQRTRDEKSDMHFADEIEQHFRTEHLFFNHYRPSVRVAASMARQVFLRLGIPAAEIEELVGRWRKTPFERTMLPIHPGVARHFGLTYGDAGQRYLYHTGEMLTFEEFALRYAAWDWNDALLRGVATNHWPGNESYRAFQGPVPAERVQAALDDVRHGLARSQGSGLGERAQAALLLRQGQRQPALAALQRAVRFDPTDAESHESLARLLDTLGNAAAAETAYRAALEEDPSSETAHAGLARLLSRQNRVAEAIPLAEACTRIEPGNGFPFFDLATLQTRTGRLTEAEASLRQAVALLPTKARPRVRLAAILIADGRLEEAERLLAEAAGLSPDDDAVPSEIAAGRRHLQRARDKDLPLLARVKQQASRLVGS